MNPNPACPSLSVPVAVAGSMGKLVIRQSGKMEVHIGSVKFHMAQGADSSFLQVRHQLGMAA